MFTQHIVEGEIVSDRLECRHCGTHTHFPRVYCSNCGATLADARRVTYIPANGGLRVMQDAAQ